MLSPAVASSVSGGALSSLEGNVFSTFAAGTFALGSVLYSSAFPLQAPSVKSKIKHNNSAVSREAFGFIISCISFLYAVDCLASNEPSNNPPFKSGSFFTFIVIKNRPVVNLF